MKYKRIIFLVSAITVVLITQLAAFNHAEGQKQLITEVINVAWNPQPTSNQVAVSSRSYSADFSAYASFLKIQNSSDMSVILDLSSPYVGLTRQIRSIDWSPDGKFLVVGISDRTIEIWNINDTTRPIGQVISKLNSETPGLVDTKWSPDGKWLASLGLGLSVKLWDVKSNFSLVDTLTVHTGSSIVWSPDSTWLASTGDIQIFVYHITSDGHFASSDTYQLTKYDEPFIYPDIPIWNASGSQIAFVDRHASTIHIFDTSTKKEVRSLIVSNGTSKLAWSPDGSRFAYGDKDTNVRIVDSTSGKELTSYPTRSVGGVAAIEWSPDGSHLAYSGSADAAAMVTLPSRSAGANSLSASQPILLLSGQPVQAQ